MSSYPNLSPPTKSSSSNNNSGSIPSSLVPDYSPYSMSHHPHHHLHHTSYDPVGMGMMSSGGMPVAGHHQFTMTSSGALEPIYHPTSASSSIQQQFGKSLIESSGEQAQMTYDEHLSAVLSSRGNNDLLVKKEDSSHHQHLHHNLHHNHLIHNQLQQSHQQYLDEKQVHLHQNQHQQHQVSSGAATSNSLATMSSGLKSKSGKISSGGGHHQSSSSNQSIYFNYLFNFNF